MAEMGMKGDVSKGKPNPYWRGLSRRRRAANKPPKKLMKIARQIALKMFTLLRGTRLVELID
jgi:hypothetical protein